MSHSDNSRTPHATAFSKARRVDDRERSAQQRLADKSFSNFMKRHNLAVSRLTAQQIDAALDSPQVIPALAAQLRQEVK